VVSRQLDLQRKFAGQRPAFYMYLCATQPTRSCDPLQNLGGSNHITGMAEPKVIKYCTQVGYINCSN